MRKIQHLIWALYTVAFLVLAPTGAQAGEIGDAGALFLRFGMGARAAGMGEAFTAVAKDASAIYWNPAAMNGVLGTHLMFMHSEYIQSIRLEQAAVTHETDLGTFGLGFTGLFMDEMDRYDDSPSAIPLGTFDAYDASFTFGYARDVLPNLSAGIAVKSVYQRIDEATAEGWAFDFGLYHISLIEGVKFAAVIANVGSAINFEDDFFVGKDFALPRVIKLGGSFERQYEALRGHVLATLDVLLPNDGGGKQHIGFEYGYDRKAFLRGGYKAGYDSQGATFGAGLVYREFIVDYAVLLVDNDLDDSHRISLGFGL
jgi:hypothetical protein